MRQISPNLTCKNKSTLLFLKYSVRNEFKRKIASSNRFIVDPISRINRRSHSSQTLVKHNTSPNLFDLKTPTHVPQFFYRPGI